MRCLAIASPELRHRLSAVGSLAREVVLVSERLSDEDAGVLSTALHADVTRIGDQWRLFRRAETNAALQRLDRDWLAQKAEATASRVHAVAKQFGRDSAETPIKVLQAGLEAFKAHQADSLNTSGLQAQEQTPASLLLVDIFTDDSHVIAAAPAGELTIYSNAAQGPERALPVAEAALRRYTAAQEKFADWSGEARAAGKIPRAYDWIFPKGAFQRGARTIQLWVDRRGSEPSFAVQIFSSKGDLEANALMNSRGFLDKPRMAASVLGKVSLPRNTIEAMERASPGKKGFQEEWIDPVAHEPLDTLVRDALCLWAKAKGYDHAIGCVPDALLAGITGCVKDSALDLDEMTSVLEREGVESLIVGKTLVIRPRNPLQEEALRVDRRPLSVLFHKAKRGPLGLSDLFAYHADYAAEYEYRPVLQRMETPIRDTFGLASQNWSLPHPLLASLGKLSESERQRLAGGERISLSSPKFVDCLFSIAEAAQKSAHGSSTDLERTPGRLVADLRRLWLQGSPGSAYTLVRRVSKGYAEITRVNPFTGSETLEKGSGLVLDRAFVPPEMAAAGMPKENARQLLGEKFRFYWAIDRAVKVSFLFGDIASSGPFTVRERLRESKDPVDLDQVPGFSLP